MIVDDTIFLGESFYVIRKKSNSVCDLIFVKKRQDFYDLREVLKNPTSLIEKYLEYQVMAMDDFLPLYQTNIYKYQNIRIAAACIEQKRGMVSLMMCTNDNFKTLKTAFIANREKSNNFNSDSDTD